MISSICLSDLSQRETVPQECEPEPWQCPHLHTNDSVLRLGCHRRTVKAQREVDAPPWAREGGQTEVLFWEQGVGVWTAGAPKKLAAYCLCLLPKDQTQHKGKPCQPVQLREVEEV